MSLLTPAEAAKSFSDTLKRVARETAEREGTSYEDELRFGLEVLSCMMFEGPAEVVSAPRRGRLK